MKKYLSLSLILVSWCLSYSQSSIGYPTIDTYIEIANPSESFSSETDLKLKHTDSESNERVILLKFSKDLIPSDGFEQVLLKLVKIEGDEGNVSVVGTSSGFGNSTSWNSAPSLETPFAYGGIKEGETLYLDVTEYIKTEAPSSSSVFSFKLFTNSIINSPIVFASNESSNESDRPQLQFYSSSKINAPLYDIHGTTSIDMDSRGNATGEIIENHDEENAINNYGGWEHGTSNATGFFRVEKDCDNTWHIIDPDGYFFYSAGLNSVDVNGGLSLPNELNDLGINTLGSWSDETIQNIAYTPRFNVMASFKNTTDDIKNTYSLDILPVFESDFENFCNELVEENVTPYVNDPWVLGYFLDNELPFHKNQLSLSLELSRSNAQYIAADNWMNEKYGSGYSTNDITDNDEADYQGYVAETYFEIVTKAFRAVDANHMLIGTRLHGGSKYIPQLFEASGKYVDVVSVNYYSRFEPEEETMEMWMENSDKPFMITEFYVKGQDTGLSNEDGAGWNVATQEDRAKWYENWMLKLLRNKGNVGFHWFRFRDRPEDGSNKGLYDSSYSIYEELAASIKKISKSIYTLRSQILYGNYNYNGCSSVNVDEIGTTTEAFVPDPNKVYYIDSAIHNARLAATGESSEAYTADENTIGSDVEWKFVAKGNGYWHLELASGGTMPRLRTDQNEEADMQPTSSSGSWTYFDFTEGAIANTYFITLPDVNTEFKRLQIDNTGTVKMVEDTRNGTWESFRITEAVSTAEDTRLEAEDFDNMFGIQTEASSESGDNVGYINDGDWLSFDDVNLSGITNMDARVATRTGGGTIEVRTGSASGTLIGSIDVSSTGGFQNWTTVSTSISNASGTQDVYLVFTGGSDYLFNVNWVEFNTSSQSNKDVEVISAVSDVIMFPNPVILTTTIENASNSDVNVYDMNGSIVFSRFISNESETIDLSRLNIGVYYVEIQGEKSTSIVKIVKE